MADNDDPDKGLTLEQALDALKKTRAEAADARVKNRELSESQAELKARLDKIDADKKAAEDEEAKKRGEFEDLLKKRDADAETERRSNAQKLAAAKRKVLEEAVRARLVDAIDPDVAKLIDLSKIQVADDFTYTGLDELVTEFKTAKPSLFKAAETTTTTTTNRNGLSNTSIPKADDGKTPDWSKSDESIDSLLAGYKASLR